MLSVLSAQNWHTFFLLMPPRLLSILLLSPFFRMECRRRQWLQSLPEYQTAPAAHDTFCFDPEDENDRELLKEDPYAEYPDFPAEYRMKDEAQIEMVYC